MYEDLELYGRVEYFLVHTYQNDPRMLAFIQWTTNLRVDNFENKTFNGYSSHSYIDVEYIDRCVGFMRIEDTFYILDKENQVVYE
jgi:hypothetical protein